jgi:hypothetical protein
VLVISGAFDMSGLRCCVPVLFASFLVLFSFRYNRSFMPFGFFWIPEFDVLASVASTIGLVMWQSVVNVIERSYRHGARPNSGGHYDIR